MPDKSSKDEKDYLRDVLDKQDVVTKSLKEQIKAKFQEKNFKKVTNEEYFNGLYLFYSFDLVNSTAYKAKNLIVWPTVFKQFYDATLKEAQTFHPNVKVWKYVGDEILLYKKIGDLKELVNAPSNTFNAIETITTRLHNFEESTKGVLFLKATLWIADIKWGGNLNEGIDARNIVFPVNPEYPYRSGNDSTRIDFLGPDIDMGFRITNHTEKSKLLISAELAYLLYCNRGKVETTSTPKYRVEDNLRIVGFEKLKGIWNGRRYPIVWYHNNWNTNSFDYEEIYESEKVKKLKNDEFTRIDLISKVFSDVNRSEIVKEYIESIEENQIREHSKDSIEAAFDDIPREKLAEVHAAAICFTRDKRLMIAKRSSHKSKLKGLWEFGCGQLKLDQTIKDCIKVNYKNDFAAEIDFIKEDPIPVTTYVVKAERERKIPGILFLGIVENPEYVLNHFSKIRHSEVRFVSMEYLDEIGNDECVPDFKQSARLAFEELENNLR
ncbi:hypothetical protein [Pseudalkalibacillus sp. NRS-1564]|uniref:hypothetical protein n=1 Tax=Pseudalkalibacillus sp. NRS-1564 TaxID=3233900 RepID=UPI003D2AF796